MKKKCKIETMSSEKFTAIRQEWKQTRRKNSFLFLDRNIIRFSAPLKCLLETEIVFYWNMLWEDEFRYRCKCPLNCCLLLHKASGGFIISYRSQATALTFYDSSLAYLLVPIHDEYLSIFLVRNELSYKILLIMNSSGLLASNERAMRME